MHNEYKPLNTIRWLAEYIPVLPFIFILRVLPHRMALRVGGALGVLAFRLGKRHRDITLKNLRECLPEIGPEKRLSIARNVYRNLGYSLVEFICSRRIFNKPFEDTFSLVGMHNLEAAIAKGKGLLILTGHCGSWEMMAHILPNMGRPMGVVARTIDNPYYEQAVTRLRSMYGNIVINKQKGMRRILKMLADGGIVAILLDQSVSRREGVFVDFFGKPACTNKGLALMAMKTGTPVVPAFIHRVGLDRHVVEVWDEIPTVDTGDKDADILANTQAYTKALENFIREHPDHWFWMHRRWKTRQPGAVDA